MQTNELVLTGSAETFESGEAHPAIRAGGTWLTRGAITVVLSVTGTAFLLVALTVLDAAPLAAVAAITWGSWLVSGRLTREPGVA
jgi:hypothetical protein